MKKQKYSCPWFDVTLFNCVGCDKKAHCKLYLECKIYQDLLSSEGKTDEEEVLLFPYDDDN